MVSGICYYFYMSIVDQALQFLQNRMSNNANMENAWSQPNPYPNLVSPIDPSQQITKQLYPGFQSPVPLNQVLPHVAGQSEEQTGIQDLGKALAQAKQTFLAIMPQQTAASSIPVMQNAVKTFAQPTSIPTPTPQMDPAQMFNGFTTTPVPKQLAPLIYNSAKNNGIDPNTFASLLFTEHGFKTDAGINKNSDGSYDRGIAQINSKAHPEISDQQALDPNFAIPWAAKTLSRYIHDMGGDYNKGIAAYNVGEGGARISGNTPSGIQPLGQEYLNKVAQGLTPSLRKRLGLKVSP